MQPFTIVFSGAEFSGWTTATLSRKKGDMTGTLEFEVFFDQLPRNPVMRGIAKGTEVQAYVGGALAFNGTVDGRTGKGKKGGHKKGADAESGASYSASATKDSYSIKVSARGKLKHICDCSHVHETGFFEKKTAIATIKEITAPFSVEAEDKVGLSEALDRTLTDGGNVADEIHNILSDSGADLYESVEGKLMIVNHGDSGSGEALILGHNILTFSCEQTEEHEVSHIKVKGNRTHKHYGKDAITKPLETLTTGTSKAFRPYTGHCPGDATPARLKKSAKNEAAARAKKGKTISVDVFHVQSSSGEPWDLNTTHYVEIPTENIFDEFVIEELTYHVSKDELKTSLKLSPKGADSQDDGTDTGMISDKQALGIARRNQMGVKYGQGTYPDTWAGVPATFLSAAQIVTMVPAAKTVSYPPLKLFNYKG